MTGKYRPPNGAEGDYFMEVFCEQCTKDDVENNILCPIIAATYAFDVDDPRYPNAWQYVDDKPVCTAFERREVKA